MASCINKCSLTWLFITISVIVGTVFLVFLFAMRSSEAKLYVVNASLTQFTSTTDNNRGILSYNLTLDVKLRNPSKMIGIRYRRIRASALYKSKKFALITFPPFYQGHKNTFILHPVFQGEALLKLGKSELEDFDKDLRLGSFHITIEFYLDLTSKLGGLKIRKRSTMLCDLRLPLGSYNGTTTAVGGFKTKKCSGKRAKEFLQSHMVHV